MDTLYFLKVYEKSFLRHHRSDKIWPYIVMSTCPNIVIHSFAKLPSDRKESSSSSEEKEKSLLLERRPTAGLSEPSEAKIRSIVRSVVMRRDTIAKILRTSHFHGTKLKKFPMQSVVKSGIDQCGHARRLQRAQSRLPGDSWFKMWLTKVMAQIGGHTRSYAW